MAYFTGGGEPDVVVRFGHNGRELPLVAVKFRRSPKGDGIIILEY